jgi:hypothetical protein
MTVIVAVGERIRQLADVTFAGDVVTLLQQELNTSVM